MIEILRLQQECLDRIKNHIKCGSACNANHHCVSHGCDECDCSACLKHIQWGNPPSFHYECEKITYHYVLRFFNRFASEISYFLNQCNFASVKEFNVISLGCGPASELYGFIKSIYSRFPHVKLNFEGYDMNPNWERVQNITKDLLAKYGLNINFHCKDIFTDYVDVFHNKPSILVLNYVLSDIAKFKNKETKELFVSQLTHFIHSHNIRVVLFNDIRYYGYKKSLNSGVQLMNLILENLLSDGLTTKSYYRYFSGDSYFGNEDWHPHKSNHLLFNNLQGNPYIANIEYCRSKQILTIIQ